MELDAVLLPGLHIQRRVTDGLLPPAAVVQVHIRPGLRVLGPAVGKEQQDIVPIPADAHGAPGRLPGAAPGQVHQLLPVAEVRRLVKAVPVLHSCQEHRPGQVRRQLQLAQLQPLQLPGKEPLQGILPQPGQGIAAVLHPVLAGHQHRHRRGAAPDGLHHHPGVLRLPDIDLPPEHAPKEVHRQLLLPVGQGPGKSLRDQRGPVRAAVLQVKARLAAVDRLRPQPRKVRIAAGPVCGRDCVSVRCLLPRPAGRQQQAKPQQQADSVLSHVAASFVVGYRWF